MPPTDPVRCTVTYWVRGVGVKECRNRATRLGYHSDLDYRPICGRHWSAFLYTGPLPKEADRATD